MDRGKLLRAFGAGLIILGIIIIIWALLSGQASVALVVIIPVIYGSSPLLLLGILSLFAGITTLFLSHAPVTVEEGEREEGAEKKEQAERQMGGVILIGPIPIVFGSAKALKGSWMLVALAILSLLLLILFVLSFVL